MTQTTSERLVNWFMNGDVGSSSKCIAKYMTGQKCDDWDYPRDAGDLGRCVRLLDAVPEFRERISEMATVGKYWAAIAPRWKELEACQADSAKCYELIKSLTRPVEKKDQSVVRIGEGASIRFGR